MYVIETVRPGGPEELKLVIDSIPTPSSKQVRIKIAAAGVNRGDIKQREGHHPPPTGASTVLGLEASGIIEAIGSDVTGWQIGDEVCALLPGGGYAEYVVVEQELVLPVPSGVNIVEAGGIVETCATVWSNLFQTERPVEGSWLLIHGSGSGIGITAIQMGVALGYRVAVTVGSEWKAKKCLDLGAEIAINYKETDFVEVLQERGVKVARVLDHIGGSYINKDIAVLEIEGQILSIASLEGADAVVNLPALTKVRGNLRASSLRARSLESKAEILSQLEAFVWPLFESGEMKPVTYERFPLGAAAHAHKILESSEHFGKVLLVP